MSHTPCSKKQNDGQLNLYKLLRLQNRDNNFIYHDYHHKYYFFISKMDLPKEAIHFALLSLFFAQLSVHFRVSYPHFPLETISLNDLLRLFWKFITTHHFQKMDQQENYKLNYLHQLFNRTEGKALPNLLHLETQSFRRFLAEVNAVIDTGMISDVESKGKAGLQDGIWMGKMLLAWAADKPKLKKTKKIAKSKDEVPKRGRPAKKLNKSILAQLQRQEEELKETIAEIDFSEEMRDDSQERDDIDEEIQRLEKLLNQNREESRARVSQLESSIREEQEWMAEQEERQQNGEDASCIEWLLHILEEKQIAESITKVTNCQRSGGQSKFLVHFQSAMNIAPLLLSEPELKRINQLRQISLFKFYKTGVKSIYSYACHNYSGLADMHQNRMNLTKFKDKDYMQAMKKGLHINPETRQELDQFDVCHHCKYIYPEHLLTTCKFVSDRQAMPKTSETETDLQSEANLQKGRVSHRFVSKHRNCFSGYAKVNEQYVCGRKFCKSCIKDCYGVEWMRNNNGLCPFCLGVCSCTRCLRNQKMNKLKTFFMSLGGDLGKLQEQSQMERLPLKKEDQSYFKIKAKVKKAMKAKPLNGKMKKKLICKENMRRLSNLSYLPQKRMQRLRYGQCRELLLDEETQRWSSTAEKELFNQGRRSNRKTMTPIY